MKYILILIAAFSTNAMAAETSVSKRVDATEVHKQSIWDIIRKKIENFVPKKRIILTSASAGVRGSLADADDLYWSGEAVEADPAEAEALRRALAITDTDRAGGRRALDEFLKTYPESGFASDVKTALRELK